jgi:hypothetical protein
MTLNGEGGGQNHLKTNKSKSHIPIFTLSWVRRITYTVPGTAVFLSWPAWSCRDVMISSCLCYGVPYLPQVPNPSSSESVTSCLGVNFIACALFLFHVPLFVNCCWYYWSYIAVDTDNISLQLLRNPLLSHKHTHTHTHTTPHHTTSPRSFFLRETQFKAVRLH